MNDADVAKQIVAIRERLAALAEDPDSPIVAAEIGAIRAQLRLLAASNEVVAERLGESLGLRSPR